MRDSEPTRYAAATLEALTKAFHAAFDKALSRPRVSLAAFVALFCVCLLGLGKLKFELTVFEINDPGFPSARELRLMREEFDDSPNLDLVFLQTSGEPLNGDQLCAIRGWIDNQSRRDDLGVDSFSPFSLRHPSYDVQSRKLLYKKIFGPACTADAGQILATLPASPWDRLLTNDRGTDLSVALSLKAPGDSDRYTGLDPHLTEHVMQSLQSDLLDKNPALRSHALGGATTELQIHEIMKNDSVYQLLILLGLLLFFRVAYGTWKSGGALVVSLLFSIVCTYATLAVLGWPFDVLSNNLFIMLCISGVEDFLFVCFLESRKSPRSGFSNRDSFLASFRDMIVPGFFTSFTTILGFLSLYSSKFGLIGRFGAMSAWAALLEWVATFFLVPLIVRLLPGAWIWIRASARAQTLKLDDFRASRPSLKAKAPSVARPKSRKTWASLGIAALLFAGGCFGFFRLNFEDAFAHAFPSAHPHSQALKYLKSSRGWEDVFQVLYDRDVSEAAVARDIAQIEHFVNVVKVDNFQRQVDFLAAQLPAEIHRLVEREVSTSDLQKRYVSRLGNQRIEVYVADSNGNQMGPLLDRIRALCSAGGGHCRPVGEAVVLEAYSKGIAKTLTESFVWSVLLVSLVILFLCWALEFRYGFRVVACSIWTPVVMVGVMAALSVRIDFITSMFLANIVGLSGDNVIQFLFSARWRAGGNLRDGVNALSGATRQLTLLLATCCAGFAFMTLIPVRVLGGLLAAGFVLTLIGDVYLLRATLPEGHPTKN